MRRLIALVGFAIVSAACGRLLGLGDDEPPLPAESDASTNDDRPETGDADGSNDAVPSNAIVDGLACIGPKQCAEDLVECCSGTRGSGCTMKCEIVCCE